MCVNNLAEDELTEKNTLFVSCMSLQTTSFVMYESLKTAKPM